MKIVFTPAVRDQLFSDIRRDNPLAAISLWQKTENPLLSCDYPETGRILPEFPDIHYRDIIVTPYRFFYRVKDDVVWVVAVWHGAQIPEDPSEII